jgi:large subunit ribosomal protein L12
LESRKYLEANEMEYIYAALLLHKAGKEIKPETVKKVLTAAGVKPDEARIKAMCAALKGVNIEEALGKAAPVAAASAPAGAPAEKKAEKKEEKKEEVSEAEAAVGLGSLFG